MGVLPREPGSPRAGGRRPVRPARTGHRTGAGTLHGGLACPPSLSPPSPPFCARKGWRGHCLPSPPPRERPVLPGTRVLARGWRREPLGPELSFLENTVWDLGCPRPLRDRHPEGGVIASSRRSRFRVADGQRGGRWGPSRLGLWWLEAGRLRLGPSARGHVLSAAAFGPQSRGGDGSGGPPSTAPVSGRRQEGPSRGACGVCQPAALGPGAGSSRSGEQGRRPRLSVRLGVARGSPARVSVPLSVPPETEVQTPGVLGASNQEIFFFFKQVLEIFPGVLRTQ